MGTLVGRTMVAVGTDEVGVKLGAAVGNGVCVAVEVGLGRGVRVAVGV